MAGDWIPMRIDLDEDPAIVGAAAVLGVQETSVIGWLWKLWSVASCQTVNGWLPHYTPQKIDGLVSHNGFAAALESVGWLLPRPGGVEIPNFKNWLSESAKKRLKDSRRKRETRAEIKCPQNVRDEVDKKRTALLSSPVLSSEGIEGGRGGEKETAPRPRDGKEFDGSAENLAQRWCFWCTRKKRGYCQDLLDDMVPQFAELLRLGHNPEVLLAEVESKERDRGEHFWQFNGRVTRNKDAGVVETPEMRSKEIDRLMAARRKEAAEHEKACKNGKQKRPNAPLR